MLVYLQVFSTTHTVCLAKQHEPHPSRGFTQKMSSAANGSLTKFSLASPPGQTTGLNTF